ncbi:CAP domain-containing protein [Singulisphaera sp. PoT]|uniref:CAP domain-containing protein n=1 Tax=Singulisphaera sp. PoT TaxID=3411797 RepID=UPI003BF5CE92
MFFQIITKTRFVAPLSLFVTLAASSSPLVARAQQPVAYQTVPASPSVVYAQPATAVTYARPAATTYVQAPTTYVQQPAAAPTYARQAAATTYTQQTTTALTGDPYGFTNWLNSIRASYGLPAVGYDANLSSWAAANNNQQQAYGMGHHVMGPARRQNSGMGQFASIGAMWMASPAHRAALLDPTIRSIGIAGLGAYWTFNAN